MNVQFLTPNILNKKCNNSTVIGSNYSNLNNVDCPNLRPLKKDTVSFTGGHKIIKTAFENDYLSQLPKLKEKGQKLLKVVEECCEEVSGTNFDKEYCEKAITKSLERYMKKFADSGSVPLDKIRTTLFIKDLYDFSIISNYIKALEKRGYYILPVPEKTIGKKVLSWRYDFDVRLNDDESKLVSSEEIKKLPVHLRNYISEKQKSGYKDIQLRVVDASGLPKEQRTLKNLSKLIPEEIICLFGKATAEAKTEESKYIYNITRKLTKMHILDANYSSDEFYKIKENIQSIGSILRSNISKPLYRNAEKLDVYPEECNILENVQLGEKQCNILKMCMLDLDERTSKMYSKLRRMIQSPEYDIEIEKIIKQTHDYKTRSNKRISDEEIRIKRTELLKQLREQKTEDLQTIKEQKINLETTIQKYKIKESDLKTQLSKELTQLDQTIEEILSGKTTLTECEVAKLQAIQIKKNQIKQQLTKLLEDNN